jgi:hypothetical protein
MTAKELLRLNTPKLREEALKIPNIVGVTAMKKDALIKLLAEQHGIALETKTPSAERADIKQHIAALKLRRDEAIERKAYDELHHIRRGIRTLKRRLRAFAKAAKTQPLGTPQEATPETAVEAPAADAGDEAAAQESSAE